MSLENDNLKLESMRKGAKQMGNRELHLTHEYEKCEQKNKEMETQRKEVEAKIKVMEQDLRDLDRKKAKQDARSRDLADKIARATSRGNNLRSKKNQVEEQLKMCLEKEASVMAKCQAFYQAQNHVLKQRLVARLNNETPQLLLPPNPVPDSELDQNVLQNLRSAIADLNKLADQIELGEQMFDELCENCTNCTLQGDDSRPDLQQLSSAVLTK